MRRTFILTAILVQIAVIGWMAGHREWIVRTSPEIWLRTAPVDPRDLFRGDYVRLGYEISTIPSETFGPGLKQLREETNSKDSGWSRSHNREIVVYTTLSSNPETGLCRVASADLTPPASGLFIKGRAHRYGLGQASLTGVSYGIDSYFVQQGKGDELEQRAQDDFLSPMDMRVALGNDGTAILTGHRMGPIGIRTEIRKPTTGNTQPTGSAMIHVTFRNNSANPLALILPPDLRTLRIRRNMETDKDTPPVEAPPLTDADVRLLQPGKTVEVSLDPAKCKVKTHDDKETVPLSSLQNDYQSFQVVYEPPVADQCKGLKESHRMFQEPLAGRMFSSYEITGRY